MSSVAVIRPRTPRNDYMARNHNIFSTGVVRLETCKSQCGCYKTDLTRPNKRLQTDAARRNGKASSRSVACRFWTNSTLECCFRFARDCWFRSRNMLRSCKMSRTNKRPRTGVIRLAATAIRFTNAYDCSHALSFNLSLLSGHTFGNGLVPLGRQPE